jgi:FMN phosphatase YigB (HAD superfamily)
LNLTLLLDLDDTLLQNDIDLFLPHYLEAFTGWIAPYLDPDRFVRQLLAGTQAMTLNKQPDCTLREVFEAVFFPGLGMDAQQFRQIAEGFYAEVFPSLRKLTRPIPAAVPLVEQALARGYRVAIATNPLFPLTAVHQRLEWANLPVERYAFDLIASYETFHFGKPAPAFFAEVLARLGWPQGNVLIVGDNLKHEVLAGRRMGLPVFWIEHATTASPVGDQKPTAQGSLEDVLPWLDGAPDGLLQPDYSSVDASMAVLRSTLAALDTFCRNLDAAAWRIQPRPAEWSLTEVLCHLRDVELEVNLPRLRRVLNETNPFLAGEDTDPWAQTRQYIQQNGERALRDFMAARMQLLHLLEGLSPEAWQRTARHAIFGPTYLSELVNIIAGHDRLHIQQVYTLLQETCVQP